MSLDALKSGERINMAIRKVGGQTLLPAGSMLTERYISRLKSFGFNAVYIDDELFNSVEAVPALSDGTKEIALKTVESFYECRRKGKSINVSEVRDTGSQIYREVFSVCNEPVSLFNLFIVDDPCCLHAVNVAVMAAALTSNMDIKNEIACDIVTGALLHDIMLDNLNTAEDKSHSALALEYLRKQHGISTISYMSVAQHHENYNGTGYPSKLKGDGIYIGSKIIRICDVYDNLIYGLAGQKRMSEYHALEYINGNVGTLFDPEAAALFNKTVAIYPTGATVSLNNGRKAIVTRQNSGMPSRPVVRLLMSKWEDCLELNLLTHKTLFIDKVEL